MITRPHDAKLLIIRRSERVRLAPGAYCFPGGGVEDGESEPVALRRELIEELELDVIVGRRVWECVTPTNVDLAWWTANLRDAGAEPRPAPDEVSECHWLTIDEILALPGLIANNVDFLIAVQSGRVRLR